MSWIVVTHLSNPVLVQVEKIAIVDSDVENSSRIWFSANKYDYIHVQESTDKIAEEISHNMQNANVALQRWKDKRK